MTLSALIRHGGLAEVATATVVTSATSERAETGTVADVASVAVATVPSRRGNQPIKEPYVTELRDQLQRACDWVGLYAILDEAQAAYDSGEVTSEEVESLTGYAADRSREVPEHPENERLSDLLARQHVVRVQSRLLGELVVWVADSAGIPDRTDEVVYRETELRGMGGLSPTDVRTIHELKRALDGELLES
jgi:hypothetical protein